VGRLAFLSFLMISSCLADPPAGPGAAYLNGLDSLKASRWPDAVAAFSQCIQADEENSDYFTARGVAFVLSQQFPQAITDLQRAIRLQPDKWEAKCWLCAAYYMSGDAATGSQNVRYAPWKGGPRDDIDYSILVCQVGTGYWNCLRGGTAVIVEGKKRSELSKDQIIAQMFPRLAAIFVERHHVVATGGVVGTAMLDRVVALHDSGDYAAAFNGLAPLLEASPEDPRLLALHADCLLGLKDYSGAREEWTRVLTANRLAGNPDLPAAYVGRARAAAAMGDARRAGADLDIAQALGAPNVRAARAEVQGLLAGQRPADPAALLSALEQAVRANGSQEQVAGLALALEMSMNARRLRSDEYYDDQLRLLSAALAANPNNPDAMAALGKFVFEERDPLRDDVEPRPAPLLYRYQTEASRKREISRATDLADQALKINPDHVGALALKASILFVQGQFGEAKVALERALTLKPNDPELLRQMAMDLAYATNAARQNAKLTRAAAVSVTQDRYDNNDGTVTVVTRTHTDPAMLARADELDRLADQLQELTKEYTEKALKVSAGTAEGFLFESWMARNRGDNQTAKADLEQAVRLKPDYRLAWYWLQDVCETMGLVEDSASARATADNMTQTTAVPWLIPAKGYIRHMKLKSARAALARATQLDPADARIQACLGVIDMADQNMNDALVHLRMAFVIEEARNKLHGRSLTTPGPLPLGPEDIGLPLALRIRSGAAQFLLGNPDLASEQFQSNVSLLAAIPEKERATSVPRSFLPNPAWEPDVRPPADTYSQLLIRSQAGLDYCALAQQYRTPQDVALAAQTYMRWLLDFYADHPNPDGLVRSVASLGLAEMYLKKGNLDQAQKVYRREVSGVPQNLWTEMLQVQSQLNARQQETRQQEEDAQELAAFRAQLQTYPMAYRRTILLRQKQGFENLKNILQEQMRKANSPDDKQATQKDIEKLDKKIAICDQELRKLGEGR
jgi:tetratricopeptide (TPR) repeat protein